MAKLEGFISSINLRCKFCKNFAPKDVITLAFPDPCILLLYTIPIVLQYTLASIQVASSVKILHPKMSSHLHFKIPVYYYILYLQYYSIQYTLASICVASSVKILHPRMSLIFFGGAPSAPKSVTSENYKTRFAPHSGLRPSWPASRPKALRFARNN